MAIKDIVDGIMHVEHGQKLLDERTNGSEKEGEENSKPLANTNFGLLKKSEQLHYKRKKGNG
jgi:hypothetical protein